MIIAANLAPAQKIIPHNAKLISSASAISHPMHPGRRLMLIGRSCQKFPLCAAQSLSSPEEARDQRRRVYSEPSPLAKLNRPTSPSI